MSRPQPGDELAHVRVVLVRTRREGNVGAAARAMLNMGITDLVLVAPRMDKVDSVRWIAHGAEDVVARARTVDTLAEALEGTSVAVATTARRRRWRSWPILAPADAGKLVAQAGSDAALVFGPEDKGLSNEDLALCTHLSRVPTAPVHTSLNLAQAVLLMAWETRKQAAGERPSRKRIPAEASQVDGAIEQMAGVLERIDFFRGRNKLQVLTTARQVLTRTDLTREEIGFLRGTMRKLAWGMDNPGKLKSPAEDQEER